MVHHRATAGYVPAGVCVHLYMGVLVWYPIVTFKESVRACKLCRRNNMYDDGGFPMYDD